MKKSSFSLVELIVVVAMLAAVAVIALCILGSIDKRHKRQQLACLNNLAQLKTALQLYGDDNRSYLPDKDNGAGLASLLRLKYIDNASLLVCPGTKDAAAPNWQALCTEGDRHCSYLYNGALYMNDLTPQSIILQDKKGNHRKLQQTIWGDFSVGASR